MGHNKGTGFTQFDIPLNLLPPIYDPTYPLRIYYCRTKEIMVVEAPILTVIFSPEAGDENQLLMETWEDIP